jgi:hypothetical protein
MQERQILNDIRRVALKLGRGPGSVLTRSEYLTNGGNFSYYNLYDNGNSWSYYCQKAGFRPKTTVSVPDEIYFDRLRAAFTELGRIPKASERKRFGLNFHKRRWPNLNTFIALAISRGVIASANSKKSLTQSLHPNQVFPEQNVEKNHAKLKRVIPPIPVHTKRKKWERIGIEGFPYAPQDESGVIALFAILCAQGSIPWQIVELRSCNGIDATCYEDQQIREFRVELKHVLSRANWNHPLDSFEYLVCWENRWPEFPKPVLELKTIVRET